MRVGTHFRLRDSLFFDGLCESLARTRARTHARTHALNQSCSIPGFLRSASAMKQMGVCSRPAGHHADCTLSLSSLCRVANRALVRWPSLPFFLRPDFSLPACASSKPHTVACGAAEHRWRKPVKHMTAQGRQIARFRGVVLRTSSRIPKLPRATWTNLEQVL